MTLPSKPEKTPDNTPWCLKCHRCGAELPLLHPHIMVEYTDDDDELICPDCHSELYPNS